MAKVGTKGQIVIDREVREALGIQPGWDAVQYRDGNWLVVEFVPPPHCESLAGALDQYVPAGRVFPSYAELREQAAQEHGAELLARWQEAAHAEAEGRESETAACSGFSTPT